MTWMQSVRDGDLARPTRAKRRFNPWWNFLVAVAYWLWETGYFGWNLTPQSGAEMACDGVALLLMMVATNRIADCGNG